MFAVCVTVVGLLSRPPVQEEVMVLLLVLCGPLTLCLESGCSVPLTSTSTSETSTRSDSGSVFDSDPPVSAGAVLTLCVCADLCEDRYLPWGRTAL